MNPENQLQSAELQQPLPSSTHSSPPLSLYSKPLVVNDSNVSTDQEGDKPRDSRIHSHRPDDLDKAIGVERTQHILVDLSLDDAKFQFIAPVWADVVG